MRNRHRNRMDRRESYYGGGASVPDGAAGSLPAAQVLTTDLTNDSDSVSEDIFSWTLEASTEYLIKVRLPMKTSAPNTGPVLTLSAIPASASGGWGLHGRHRATSGISFAPLATDLEFQSWEATTVAGVVMIHIADSGDGGTLTLGFLSEVNGDTITVEVGTSATIREPELSDVLDADVTNDDAATFVNTLSIALEAGKTYLLEGMTGEIADASSNGARYRWQDSAGDATLKIAKATPTGSIGGLATPIRRDNTEVLMLGGCTAVQAGRILGLVTTVSATTLTLQMRPEIGDPRNTTYKQHSFITAREVTANELASDVTNSDQSNHSTVFSHVLEADKYYEITQLVPFTTSAESVSVHRKFSNIPVAGVDLEEFYFNGIIQDGTFNMLGQSLRSAIYDGSEAESSDFDSADEFCAIDDVFIEVDGTGGTMTYGVARDAGAGTITAEIGAFAVVEEVEVLR